MTVCRILVEGGHSDSPSLLDWSILSTYIRASQVVDGARKGDLQLPYFIQLAPSHEAAALPSVSSFYS